MLIFHCSQIRGHKKEIEVELELKNRNSIIIYSDENCYEGKDIEADSLKVN